MPKLGFLVVPTEFKKKFKRWWTDLPNILLLEENVPLYWDKKTNWETALLRPLAAARTLHSCGVRRFLLPTDALLYVSVPQDIFFATLSRVLNLNLLP